MKKALKIIGSVIAGLLLIVIVGTLFINFRGIPNYEVQKIAYQHEASPQSLERGKKLVSTLCAGCHLSRETGKLTGKHMTDAPTEFGIINSANITGDKTFGIGEWTDGDILYLLRTGIKRDGSYAPPYMAKLPKMADEDINAIISFLRSNDPLVAADPTPDKPTEPSFLTKLLCNVAFKPLPFPKEKIAMPDSANTVEWGKYLTQNLECYSCHSADFKTNDFLNPENSKGFFGGGNKPRNMSGQVILTPNLTPDQETGIGLWTKEKFIAAVKSGVIKGENALQSPMQPYVFLTETEVGAIYDYLQTIPPIKNKVERSIYN